VFCRILPEQNSAGVWNDEITDHAAIVPAKGFMPLTPVRNLMPISNGRYFDIRLISANPRPPMA
jgi:hypothetical protein